MTPLPNMFGISALQGNNKQQKHRTCKNKQTKNNFSLDSIWHVKHKKAILKNFSPSRFNLSPSRFNLSHHHCQREELSEERMWH